jgi:hypothetical protein
MNEQMSIQATAHELIELGREQGFDLAPIFRAELFWAVDSRRYLSLMRKDGALLYYLSGEVTALPKSECLPESGTTLSGCYSENGIVEDLEQAFQLLKAWLLDLSEVDNLPRRLSGRLGRIG